MALCTAAGWRGPDSQAARPASVVAALDAQDGQIVRRHLLDGGPSFGQGPDRPLIGRPFGAPQRLEAARDRRPGRAGGPAPSASADRHGPEGLSRSAPTSSASCSVSAVSSAFRAKAIWAARAVGDDVEVADPGRLDQQRAVSGVQAVSRPGAREPPPRRRRSGRWRPRPPPRTVFGVARASRSDLGREVGPQATGVGVWGQCDRV